MASGIGGGPTVLDVKPADKYTATIPLKKPTTMSKAARDRIAQVIDLTAASTIAGKHIEGMNDSARSAVIETAEKNHRKLENKNVKAAV